MAESPFGASSTETATAEVPAWVADALARARDQRREEGWDAPQPKIARNLILAKLAELGMTQADLARKIKMAPTSLSRVLRDPAKTRVSTLRRIAKGVDLDVSQLL